MDPMDMEVEVLRGNGAYYKAYVTDVFAHKVTVAFEDDWLPQSNFEFHFVRLPAPENKFPKNYKQGDEIEVFSKLDEDQHNGWWKGIIKIIHGQFLVVEYLGRLKEHTEIVSFIRIRPKNPNPSITKSSFIKFEINVPYELQEYSKNDKIYLLFQDNIGAPICRYIPEKGVLSIVSRDQRSKIKADMLKDFMFKNMQQKLILLKMTERAAKQLQMAQNNVVSCNADYAEGDGRESGGLSKSKGRGGARLYEERFAETNKHAFDPDGMKYSHSLVQVVTSFEN